MKVCLISAPTANDFDDREIAESEAVRLIAEHAPLGILSLAAVLEQRGLVPDIVDLNRLYYQYLRSDQYADPATDFSLFAANYFSDKQYDFVGFSTICSSYPVTLRVAGHLKRMYPEATVALGGPQASVVDMATMRAYPFIDLVIRGEAERTFPAVLDCLDSKQPPHVPGVTYRKNGAIVRNENAQLVLDLDALPFPAFHLYSHMSACSYVPLELGRGCPFACSFCSTNDFFRRRFRLKSPHHMLSEMKRVKDTYGIDNFDLVHDMFTVDRKRVMAFCQAIIDSGEKFFWGCSARTDCIDDEMIEFMSEAGCKGIFFGIETGSESLQKTIVKNLNLQEARDRIKTCDKFEIKTAVSLITGFPEETDSDLRDTVEFFMDSLRYDNADPQLCILAPLADTPISKQHAKDLIFDDIMSDMSFQGWRQDPADRRMIAEHADIFTNFYSIPLPHLDRPLIKELREFILNGARHFRWLFIGLHQESGSLLDVFTQWRTWRRSVKGEFPEGNVTSYYAQIAFRQDFLEFVRSQYLPHTGEAFCALATLADFDANILETESHLPPKCEGKKVAEFDDECISPESRPRLASGADVTRLDADYQIIVQLLRDKGSLVDIPRGQVTIVRCDSTDGSGRGQIIRISEASSELLKLCDGKRTVREIARKFAVACPPVPGVSAEQACLFGIELLRRQRIVELSRKEADSLDEELEAVHSAA